MADHIDTKKENPGSSVRTQIHAADLFSVILSAVEEGRDAAFTVSGMSMWPLLCHGRDTVILTSARGRRIVWGDIVLLRIPPADKYILHRVTRVLPDGRIETTGDGNCFRDGIFPPSCITAVCDQVIRKGRRIRCRSVGWRMIFSVWMFLFPVRAPLLQALRAAGNLKRRLFLR